MTFKQINKTERIELVDALRGFALLGILFANIPFHYYMNGPLTERTWMVGNQSIDEILGFALRWFIDKKFITIFSILFGFGFYIQYERAKQKAIDFSPYIFRRMILLFIIGCIHAYLIWFGDILRDYAIAGILLLLILKLPDRKILRTGIFFIVFITGLVFILNGVFEMNKTYSYDVGIINRLEFANSYLEYFKINFTIDPIVNFIHDSPLTLSFAFGCMLLGFWLGKKDFFRYPERFSRMIKKWIWIGFTFGIAASITFGMVMEGTLELDLPIIWVVFLILIGMLLQSLAYVGLFALLFSKPKFKKRLKIFIPIGQMALTNYIFQSIIYTVFMFHWFPGFKLYGQLTFSETLLIAVVIFATQTLISYYWMKNFSQGPLEYVWKKLCYYKYKNPK